MAPQRIQPVRVLFMDHVPRMSGAEQSLCDLVVGLAAGPVEPIVVLPGDGPLAADLRANGVLVRMVPMSKRMLETSRGTLASRPFTGIARMGSFLAASWRLYRLVREVRPRLVHTNTMKSHLLAILPCTAARVPLVWHVRDILPAGWLRRVFVALARFTTVVIVPSRAVAEPFKGHKRLYRKLRLIPNGIRVEEFQDARNDRSLREMMNVGPSDPVIGIVGRIAPWKGQDVFLRAAAMVAQRHPRAHFAIIGAVLFPENDAAFEQQLHQMAYQLGIEDRVTFLGWQPAPEAMAAIDVMVHASQEPEPFGRAIVEAMAAGKPVIAAAGGAVQEIVPPSAGFVVPPGRPELLADAMDRLLVDKKLRKHMGEAGAALAENFFHVSRTVQSVGGLYRSIIAHRKPPRAGMKMLKRIHKPKGAPQQAEQAMSWPGLDAPVGSTETYAAQSRAPRRANDQRRAPEGYRAPEKGRANDQRRAPEGYRAPEPNRAPEPPRRSQPQRPRRQGPDEYEPFAPSDFDLPNGFDDFDPPPPPRRGNGGNGGNGGSPLPGSSPVTHTRIVLPDTAPRPSSTTDEDAAERAPRRPVPRAHTTVPLRAPKRGKLKPPTPAPRPESKPVAKPQRAPERAPERAPLRDDIPHPHVPLPRPDLFAPRPVYDVIKRIIDFVVSLLILVIGLPIWLTIAILIKLDSRGPVLHKGTVYGKDCKPFTYYKFRSMRIDGSDHGHRRFIEKYVKENAGHEVDGTEIFKYVGDDRVTAVGRFIRATSLDEIPQMVNVVRGQMSLIGPRPPLTYEFEHYDDAMKQRLLVLPGISGFQQVWSRHMASFEDKLKMDLNYIDRRSIWVDIKLMLRTIPEAIRGH